MARLLLLYFMYVLLCSGGCEAKKHHKKTTPEGDALDFLSNFVGDTVKYPPILCPSMWNITFEGEYLCLSTEGAGAINSFSNNNEDNVTYFGQITDLSTPLADRPVFIITRRPTPILSGAPLLDAGFVFGVRIGTWSLIEDDAEYDPYFAWNAPNEVDFICVVAFTFSTKPLVANCVNAGNGKDSSSTTWLQLQFSPEANCDVNFLLSTSMSFGLYENRDALGGLGPGSSPFRFTATSYCRKVEKDEINGVFVYAEPPDSEPSPEGGG